MFGHMSEKEFESRMRCIQFKNKQIEYKNKLKKEKNKVEKFKANKMNTSTKVLIASIFAIVSLQTF